MDNLRRALSLRWCRQANRYYGELVALQAERVAALDVAVVESARTIATLTRQLNIQTRLSRNIAAIALSLCPDDADGVQAALEDLVRQLRDQVALAEEQSA